MYEVISRVSAHMGQNCDLRMFKHPWALTRETMVIIMSSTFLSFEIRSEKQVCESIINPDPLKSLDIMFAFNIILLWCDEPDLELAHTEKSNVAFWQNKI